MLVHVTLNLVSTEEHAVVSLTRIMSVNARLTITEPTATNVSVRNNASHIYKIEQILTRVVVRCVCDNNSNNIATSYYFSDINPCDSNPCLNSGTCSRQSWKTYVCTCTVNYSGPNCNQCECTTTIGCYHCAIFTVLG